ncbi:MAG: histidinol dehydrogenase [Oscillospiraceae bacterium]|nr:histidinol dehydrogenase [Oscillospiraceae bacterium]
MIKIISAETFVNRRTTKKATTDTITATVSAIISDIINRGDKALREYTEKFDGCTLDHFELPISALDDALNNIDPEFADIMRCAAKNIEAYHRRQVRTGFEMTPAQGIILGQRITPLKRVGLYIPGGTAAYPSSVLMNVLPAKIAGVDEIIIVTPPSKSGAINPGILAAAKIAGADRVFTIGGAQAVAALAYGTETIPRVDKITGPGNAYVAEAKRQVFGIVGIDMIAGPSDILIIADESAQPQFVAADMLSQCEHGSDSPAVLVTTCSQLASKVKDELETQLNALPRKDIARQAIDNHGMIIVASSLDQAFDISNELAPEHLEILLEAPMNYLDKVKNAGSVFLGKHTPEALCDYYAGPNHTLPTDGTARFSSPLTVDDFIKKSSYTYYSKEALLKSASDVIRFAEEEGLCAHAKSVEKRIEMP